MTDAHKCTNCGLCRKNCPVFRVTLNETNSPRGKALLIRNGILSDAILKCTRCGSCEVNCPLNVDFDFKGLRMKLSKSAKNKEMVENIRKYGNPFGKRDKDKIPEDLYCC